MKWHRSANTTSATDDSFKWGDRSAGRSANFKYTWCFMLCFTEGLFVLHTKDLISFIKITQGAYKRHGVSSLYLYIYFKGNKTLKNILWRLRAKTLYTRKVVLYISISAIEWTLDKLSLTAVNFIRNIGKYKLNHVWDRVLFNTPGLKIGSSKTKSTYIIMAKPKPI